ncbi:MAG: hypothetical protein GY719_31640 [bacterium]|nr:hypothetical protein [bacterium]
MTSGAEKDGQITWKQLAAIVGALSAAMAVASFIHAKVVVPAIMERVIPTIDDKIGHHLSSGPHPGAVTMDVFQSEMRSLRTSIGAAREVMSANLAAMEQRLRMLEDR